MTKTLKTELIEVTRFCRQSYKLFTLKQEIMKYKFTENGQEKEMTYSELFHYFGGTFDEDGKKIMPTKAKKIIRVGRQGGTVDISTEINSKVAEKAVIARKATKSSFVANNSTFVILAKHNTNFAGTQFLDCGKYKIAY